MAKGGVLLLPLEAQLAEKTLLPLLYHNLVVNSASGNIYIYSHPLPDGIQLVPHKTSLTTDACLFYGAESLQSLRLS